MKKNKEARQLGALGRLMADIEKYEKWVKNPPKDTDSKHWEDKLKKARQKVEHLEKKGITL